MFRSCLFAVFISIPVIISAVSYLSQTSFAIKYTEWMMVLAHIWLMYYYISLALRENILRVVSSSNFAVFVISTSAHAVLPLCNRV